MKITLDTYVASGPLIKVGSSFVPASQTANLTKNLLNNHDFMIPSDAPDKGTRLARAGHAFNELHNNFNRMYELDKANFENMKKEKPELQVEGVWPPMPLTNTQSHFNNTVDMLKNWFQVTAPGWGPIFKASAEAFARNNNKAAADQQVERMKAIEPLVNLVADFYENVYPVKFQKVVDEFTEQQKKYQQALSDQEARKLLAEAEKTRELAAKMMEESKKAEAVNKPVEAKVLVEKAQELTKKAETQEAIAESKMPKSKVGIALALAAAGALILASQE